MAITPLISARRLANALGESDILLKLESANPFSHTFKDRGAIAAVNAAVRLGSQALVAGSCGNMGAAVAAASARAGISSFVILSEEAPESTYDFVSRFATRLFLVEERFDEIDSALHVLTNEVPSIPCINTTLNSYFKEGFRSLFSELLSQLDHSQSYVIVVPTADGTLISACWEEYERYRSSVEDPVRVRFVIAQAGGCAPLVRAFTNDLEIQDWNHSSTVVLPLSVQLPKTHGHSALASLKNTGGFAISVGEENIPVFARHLEKLEGIASDLVGGVLIGAIHSLVENKMVRRNETVVGILTSHGLGSKSFVKANADRTATKLRDCCHEIRDYFLDMRIGAE